MGFFAKRDGAWARPVAKRDGAWAKPAAWHDGGGKGGEPPGHAGETGVPAFGCSEFDVGLMGMGPEQRLLIVDDELSIVQMLEEFFRMEGYEAVCAQSAEEALRAVNRSLTEERAGIDLALLDVNMPGMDGFELCRRIREHLSCPIIFLTARVEDVDQLDGFAAGADDYVLKPFSLEVLGGRVRAHLAREARRDASRPQSVRIFHDLTIDYAERTVEVSARDARISLDLTRTEFDIIALLSKNPGRVYDRVHIYEQVWGWGATGDPSIVREHVRRVRKKFAEAGLDGEVIETVWGVGYRWAAR